MPTSINKAKRSSKQDQNLCKYYLENGYCLYKDHCWFKHPQPNEVELQQLKQQNKAKLENSNPYSENYSDNWFANVIPTATYQNEPMDVQPKEVCRFYLNNTCKFGSNCRNLHSENSANMPINETNNAFPQLFNNNPSKFSSANYLPNFQVASKNVYQSKFEFEPKNSNYNKTSKFNFGFDGFSLDPPFHDFKQSSDYYRPSDNNAFDNYKFMDSSVDQFNSSNFASNYSRTITRDSSPFSGSPPNSNSNQSRIWLESDGGIDDILALTNKPFLL